MIVTGRAQASTFACLGSHAYLFSSRADKKLLSNALRIVIVLILPLSIYVGHGHLKHAGAGWQAPHCLCYLAYLIPEPINLKVGIVSAHGEYMAIEGSTGDGSAHEDVLATEEIPNN